MTDTAILRATRDRLEAECREAGQKLKAFPKLDNGLTPDGIKATPEWKTAKLTHDNAFCALRSFNQRFAKQLRIRT